jgi:hypothetical protein
MLRLLWPWDWPTNFPFDELHSQLDKLNNDLNLFSAILYSEDFFPLA